MRSSLTQRHRGPLVLAYHAVSPTWRSPLAISPSALREQAGYLRDRGYVGLTISEAERRRQEGTLPPRSVAFTFDDGFASTISAVELLGDAGFPGTVFLVTSFVDSGEPLSWPGISHELGADTAHELRPLSWVEAARLVEAGWEVGSHTMTHPLLTSVDDELLRTELERSRAAVEQRLGACTSLAYPYGIADERISEAAKASGYLVACTLTFAHVVDEPLRRPRVGLGSRDTGLRLAAQTSYASSIVRRSAIARRARALRRRRHWLPGG